MCTGYDTFFFFQIDLPPAGFPFQILAIFMTLLEGNAFATFVSGSAPDPLTVRPSKIEANRETTRDRQTKTETETLPETEKATDREAERERQTRFALCCNLGQALC